MACHLSSVCCIPCTFLHLIDVSHFDDHSSSILKQDDGLSALFNHLHVDVLSQKKTMAQTDKTGLGSSKSVVMLEESGLKVEQQYKKFSQNSQGFSWEKGQRMPPATCPDLECIYESLSSDPDQCDETAESSTGTRPIKRSKRRKGSHVGTEKRSCSAELCSGYGYESPDDCLRITPKLNLSRIFNIPWMLPYHYPGLHSTYLYCGSTHTFFTVHVEDALTWSLNYLYLGHPKVW